MTIRLGIDTGGTYTDAVLVDADGRLLAFHKSLTTRHELSAGIGDSLAGLPGDLLARVELVALSTTLSTNAVVEGRGAPVCLLLPGYRRRQVERSGLADIVEQELIVPLEGGHDAVGQERQALDTHTARDMILRFRDRVSAFGVSSMFGVRNPEHEITLRSMIRELTDRPVTCGHELSSALDAPRRALTVALNARMVPTIFDLIRSVQRILDDRGIRAPLMMVKGDGSLVNLETALQQPVGTVLSGPAASVIGACALSGARNAIVADMGGTTTDIAIVSNGQPELDFEGVVIGDCRPMVEAVRVFSLGLGGDSEVHFGGSRGIEIGPRRVVPMSLLADQFPHVTERLARQLKAPPNARNNRFAMRLEQHEVLLSRLDGEELGAWDRLAQGPLELQALIDEDRPAARALARLQRLGLVIFSGFTPTDAAHVLGTSEHWNGEAARLACLLWARQMRHVYGLGRWPEGDAEAPARDIMDKVTSRIGRALIDAALHQEGMLDSSRELDFTGTIARLITGSAAGAEPNTGHGQRLFELRFAGHHPVVAVGAPAATWYPAACRALGAALLLPEHAGVANAYGAVLGSVVQRAHVTVAQPRNGVFKLYCRQSPRTFTSLQEAIRCAEALAAEEAAQLAAAAGACDAEVCVSQQQNRVEHDIDGDLFLETRITATATGRPSPGAAPEPNRAAG